MLTKSVSLRTFIGSRFASLTIWSATEADLHRINHQEVGIRSQRRGWRRRVVLRAGEDMLECLSLVAKQ